MSLLSKAGALAGALPGLLIRAEKVAQSFMRGVHGRRRIGSGETFWQFRLWQPGDARRDIDWRQSGKADAVFVRQTEWEAAQTVWLYRDASASMDFGGKKDFAELLLLSLGIVLLNGGEQVSLLGTALAPQSGYAAIQRLYEALPKQLEMKEGLRPLSAQAHLVIISDFYFSLDEFRTFCAGLAARRISATLVQVYHPDEKSLPYSGHVKFEDVELPGGEALDIQQVNAIREEYERRFAGHQRALGELARGFGWVFESFPSDAKPEIALTTLYDRLSTHA